MKFLGMPLLLAACLTFAPNAFAKDGDTADTIVAVNDVYIPSNFDSGSDAFAVVSGLFTNSCYKVSEVKVENVQPNVQEVTTHATVTSGLCLAVMVPFHKEVQLGKLAPGEHTVRFMSGNGTYFEKSFTIER